MKYLNLQNGCCSQKIDTIFPNWKGKQERVAVFGAHDDDPLIGAGYAMHAALEEGAQVFVVIFCKGDCGYSLPEQRGNIVEIRRNENKQALVQFGISEKNIVRFEYPDFSLMQYVGYHLSNGEEGIFLQILQFIRQYEITRVLVPNGYREHSDHTAAFEATLFDVVQAGDEVVTDRGVPYKTQSFLQYSVWADFSPEDALVDGRNPDLIRANRAVWAEAEIEEKIRKSISAYASQKQIIKNLISARDERKVQTGYIELYLDFDPRPRLDFLPYTEYIRRILK